MGLVQNLIKGLKGNKEEYKEKLKQAQMDDKIHNTVEQRKKSSNERDLEERMRRKREENIKEQLTKLRNEEKKEAWSSNMMKQKSILKNENPILKQKNIFKQEKNMFLENKSKCKSQNKTRLHKGW